MELDADRHRQVCIDQLLHPAFGQQPEQIRGVVIAELRGRAVQAGIITMGHRVFAFLSEYLVVRTYFNAKSLITLVGAGAVIA